MRLKLNLTSVEESTIKYRKINFPDGQQDLVIEPADQITQIGRADSITIQSRLNSFQDLEYILCATTILRHLGCNVIFLYVPYLLGSRSDRRFLPGGTSYLVDVLAPIINAQNYTGVFTLDVHSYVAQACIKNLHVQSNAKLVQLAMDEFKKRFDGDFALVSPDAVATNKIYKLAKELNYDGPILACTKTRDEDGNLYNTNVPMTDAEKSMNFLIVDDICDGGRTFRNIVTEAQKLGHTGKVGLVVTHGIFSSGFEVIDKVFDLVYSTNSFKDHNLRLEYDKFLFKKII